MNTKRCFVSVYLYGVLPVLVLWCIVLVCALHIYLFKLVLFLSTGSPSLYGYSGALAAVPALAEAGVGVSVGIFSCGLHLLYVYYSKRRERPAQEDVPLGEIFPEVEDNSPPVLY